MENKKIRIAELIKSIWGNTWRVDEIVGGCLHCTHFDTLREAMEYCDKGGIFYKIIA